MRNFINEELQINDYVIFLKNERTGSSTVRKVKYVGRICGFTDCMVYVNPLSRPDTYEIYENKKAVRVYPEDIICKLHGLKGAYIWED